MKQWMIYGAGGHACVIADLIRLAGDELLCIFNDAAFPEHYAGVPVYTYNHDVFPAAWLVSGIGNNKVRQRISETASHRFGTLIHPRASVAADVVVGEGTVVLAGAVIQPGAVIGKHVIINAGVVIDHDARIGDYASIYPNSYVGGEAVVGNSVVLGPGTIVMSNTNVDAGTHLSAGGIIEPAATGIKS